MNETKQKCLKNSATAVTLVIAGIIAGLLLLALVYMLPTWRVNYHIGESMWTLREEGTYPKIKTGEMLDNSTDAKMVDIIYNKGETFAEDMLLCRYISDENVYVADTLFNYMRGEADKDFEEISYGRYWHGYQSVLTPLFFFFNISQIRTLNMAAQIVLIFAIVALLGMRQRADMIIPFASMYLTLAPISLFYSFQFSSTFYVMCFLLLAVLLKYDKWSFTKLCFAFEVAGILEAYFDFLTYPAVSFGVPMIMYFTLDASARKTLLQRVKGIILMPAAWGFGYVGMWSGKWVVASAFTDENIIADAISNLKFRSSTSQGEDVYTYFGTVMNNVYYVVNSNNGLFRIIIIAMVIVCLLWLLRKKGDSLCANAASVAAIAVCCYIPFAWYLVTINHSNIHSWFTFRELSITVYGAMTLLYLTLYRKPKAMPDVP